MQYAAAKNAQFYWPVTVGTGLRGNLGELNENINCPIFGASVAVCEACQPD